MSINGILKQPTHDRERLEVLSQLSLDYEQLEQEFKPIMKLAARLTGASVSLLNILDHSTQWTAARYGNDIIAMPKSDSVCQYTIEDDVPFEVKKLSADSRFRDKFYVSGEPYLDYYFGIPISYKNSVNIGSFCVLNQHELELDADQIETLRLIAEQVSKRIEAISHTRNLEHVITGYKLSLGKITHEIRNQVSIIASSTELMRDSDLTNGDQDLLDAIQNSSSITLKKLISFADNVRNMPTYPGVTTEEIKNRIEKYYGSYTRQRGMKLFVNHDRNDTLISVSVPKVVEIAGKLIVYAISNSLADSNIEVDMRLKKLPSISNKCYLFITVRDESVGLNAGELEKLRKTLTPESLSKALIRKEDDEDYNEIKSLLVALKSTIEIDSEPGLGTTFTVEIPTEAVGFASDLSDD